MATNLEWLYQNNAAVRTAVNAFAAEEHIERYDGELSNWLMSERCDADGESDELEMLKAERDELKKRVDEQQETLDVDCCDLIEYDNEICRLTAERDQITNAINELQKKQPYCYNPEQPLDTLNTIGRYIDELKTERDEWKAKYEGQVSLAGRSSASYLRKLDECEELERERDEWKAKAESKSAKRAEVLERVEKLRGSNCDGYELLNAMFGEAPNDGTWKIDSDIDKLIDLLTDDDGVTNLEWLFENDYETLCDQMGGQPCSCCVVGCKEDLGSDEACAKALREWLMAPHEDVHPKAQSKTEQLLTEQSELLSDANDNFTPESVVTPEAVDANDANATQDAREKINALRAYYGAGPTAMTDEQIEAGHEVYGAKKHADMVIIDELHDTREKLEADVRDYYRIGLPGIQETELNRLYCKQVLEWLDRQAAITANETSHENPYVGLVRGKQWERTEMSDYYCGRCGWKVTDHDSYCHECGGALHGGSSKSNERAETER